MRVVDAIARSLYDAGVRYAFGIPGGEVLHLLEAFRDVGIQFILTRHEMGAGFMADAVSRLSDGPSVLVATLGPGLTNTVTPVAQAYLDRSPLVVITGAIATNLENIYTHQIIDQTAILKPITKFSVTVRAADAGKVTAKALSIAFEGRPGPVHLNLPTDVAQMDVATSVRQQKTIAVPQQASVPIDVQRSLQTAQRPIALVGLGVSTADTASATKAFLENWRIPAMTTYKAKGVIPENQLLSLGAIGLSPVIDQIQQSLLRTADLVVTIGFDPVELRSDWILPLQSLASIINVDVVSATHHIFLAQFELIGDIGSNLHRMSENTAEFAADRWPETHLSNHRGALKRAVRVTGSEGLHPYDVLEILREELPPTTVACVDTGSHRILTNHVWECYEPNGLLQSNGLGSMAYALPAAIAAQLLYPDRTVICLTGDAGLDMITGEMALLAAHKLKPIIVVFTDRALSLIKLKQERMNLPTYGVDFDVPSYTTLARAYGGQAYTVNSAKELRNTIRDIEGASRETFVLIEARINPADYRQQM
ncbi:thiamine pyrophosphate-binding protein [Alicyclobacillus ferrooxydans]|uniref:Acetolactate synthase n=1 Tax=Alicyclobacillus ferrooxydans TaxID=471514 RepID=A0A0N8PPR8_9BACL|nr:thiamine pyrophosphate-binding protein [Alicyclobacillus ferrooxydans]KPV45085.1 hypothetical protein AN477_03565 [Alicyclobacillus ferrooxydans]